MYGHTLPPALITHVTAICGDEGKRWLSDLPQMIAELEKRWSIRVLEPFTAIEFNFVARAVQHDSEPVVIKIAPPFENGEARSEARYLRALNGDGVIKLLAEDAAAQAMLLEQAIPGRNLAEVYAGNKPACLGPAIEVLKLILKPVPTDKSEIVSLDDWFDGLRRHVSTEFPAEYATYALDLYDNVLKKGENYYLHGDFHPANVVSATRMPFLAIDPKGMIGPIGYDIAVFLNNYHWWQDSRTDIRGLLDEAVDRFSVAFNIPAIELRQWAFAQMVLSAWWTFDELPDEYDREVAKADVWGL